MILSLRSSIRRLFSFIKTMIMIDTAMIAKNVIKTLNDGAEIENSHGIACRDKCGYSNKRNSH